MSATTDHEYYFDGRSHPTFFVDGPARQLFFSKNYIRRALPDTGALRDVSLFLLTPVHVGTLRNGAVPDRVHSWPEASREAQLPPRLWTNCDLERSCLVDSKRCKHYGFFLLVIV